MHVFKRCCKPVSQQDHRISLSVTPYCLPFSLHPPPYLTIVMLDLLCRGDPEAKAEYDAIASAVFSNPPLASVGLSEEQAVEQFGDVDVFTSSFK